MLIQYRAVQPYHSLALHSAYFFEKLGKGIWLWVYSMLTHVTVRASYMYITCSTPVVLHLRTLYMYSLLLFQFPSFIHTQKRNPGTHLKVSYKVSRMNTYTYMYIVCTFFCTPYSALYVHVHCTYVNTSSSCQGRTPQWHVMFCMCLE